MKDKKFNSLRELPNISTVVSGHLEAVGITSPEKLRELGSREAFLRIKEQRDPSACLNMLCGLEGAIQGIRWFHLPKEEKEALKAFHQDHR